MLDTTSLDKDVVENISEDVISFESVDVNQPAEDFSSIDAFRSDVNADNSMDFNVNDLTAETPVESMESEPLVTVDGTQDFPAFDATIISNDSFTVKPVDISVVSESASIESNDFNMDFMLPEDDVANNLEHQSDVVLNQIDDISFDLDFALDEPASTSVKPADNDDTEILFDLPEIKESVTSDSKASQTNDLEANTFDLSSISLDLGETESELLTEKPSLPDFVDSEPQDVNIKLDLVAAYIDMDDKEGARELLEEVIKEGGVNQKARAQQLLDNLA